MKTPRITKPPYHRHVPGAKPSKNCAKIITTLKPLVKARKEVPMDNLLTAALEYAKSRKPVFPCNPADKTPLVPGGFKAATISEKKITEWWKRWPDASIGMRMGPLSNLFLLDVDRPKESGETDGEDTLTRLVNRYGPFPETLTARTPSRGTHYYYQWPEGQDVRNSTSQIGEKLDIRGDGGYSVVPPSPGPNGGPGYEWINTVAPAPAPQWLLDLIRKPPKNKYKDSTPPRFRPDVTTSYGQAALEAELERLASAPEGTRNDTLNKVTFALGQLVAGGELDQDTILDLLLKTAVDIGLPEREARKTIESGLTSGMQEPRTATPPPLTLSSGEDIPIKDIISAAFDDQKGAATLFTRLFKGRLCLDHAAYTWHVWAGHVWKPDPYGEPIASADAVQGLFEKARAHCSSEIVLVGQRMKDTTDENEQLKLNSKKIRLEKQEAAAGKQIKKLNALSYRKMSIEFSAQGHGSLGISGEEWDLLPWALPAANGVVDLKTGTLAPGRPDDYLKTSAPTLYDPAATCPQWEEALMDIFNEDLDLIRFMQRVLGMALVGDQIEHVLIVLCGAGRNGKDTLLSALGHALGPLAGPVQSELLLDQGRTRSSSGPSADIMALRGRRVAWASETNEGRRMDSGRVKLLTGGGSLVGRAPFGKLEVTFPQSHTLFLLTNSKPHAPSEDYALWKRLHLVPFTQSFVDEPELPHERKADKYLLDRLKGEAPGILVWLVRGCLEWQAHGLNPPEVVSQATLEYRNSEDLLLQFVEERCITGPNYETAAQALYNAYKAWAMDNNLKPMSGTAFGRKMGEKYNKIRKRFSSNPSTAYEGIGIIEGS